MAETPLYSTRSGCRVCGADLASVLTLGNLHLSGFPLPSEASPPRVPLDLCMCEGCRLVQLRHTVVPDILYRQYWYRSGVNEVMRAELADIAQKASEKVSLGLDDYIVDVGANDGTLLAAYGDTLAVKVAFEPALNLHDALKAHADIIVKDYFPPREETYRFLRGKVQILTSIACFYDLDDPRAFVAAVADLLAPDGVWIVQFQDLHQMIQTTAFDNICHEHLCYYSLETFEATLKDAGLTVVEAEQRAINGGSYRLYVRHTGVVHKHPSVSTLRLFEYGWQNWGTLERFAWRVGEVRAQIGALVHAVLDQDKTIDLYAASTKANTLLQYCGLDNRVIRQAWERSPEKVGRETAGTRVPIVSEEAGRHDPPDVLMLGAWQFRDAFVEREAGYLRAGGQMLVPLPACEIVTAARKVSA